MTLLIGGLYLRAKWNGSNAFFERFPSRRMMICLAGAIFLPAIVLPLCFQSSAKVGYFLSLAIVRRGSDPSDQHSERMIVLADTIGIWGDSQSLYHYFALSTRAEMLFRLGRYDEAIAEFDKILELDHVKMDSGFLERNYTFRRGVARLLKGDITAAIEGFDFAVGNPDSEGYNCSYYEDALVFYHRAVAKEKLGDLPGATADYSRTIENLERYAEPPSIQSAVPRPESEKDRTIKDWRAGDVGYKITLDGLKTIRDHLQSQ